MNTTLTLIDLAGSIALLLWGVHMVQSGIQRAFGPHLRRFLGRALGGRYRAFLAGLGVTAVLQSSTATGLMATSFAAGGLVDLVPALAVMLGANVGTTLIVQLLSFDISRLRPFLCSSVCSCSGEVLSVANARPRPSRDWARADAFRLATAPLDHHALRGRAEPAPADGRDCDAADHRRDPRRGADLGGAFERRDVLLIISLAANGVVPPHAAFALVLGANLGSALNPLLEGAGGGRSRGKAMPVGNLLNRLVGVALGLVLLDWIGPFMVTIEPDRRARLPIFTPAFNLVTAALFLPLLRPLRDCSCGCCRRVRPRPTRRGRSISTRRRARRRRLPWPGRRAKRCAWPMSSRRCCAEPSMRSIAATASGSPRPRGSTMCSTG